MQTKSSIQQYNKPNILSLINQALDIEYIAQNDCLFQLVLFSTITQPTYQQLLMLKQKSPNIRSFQINQLFSQSHFILITQMKHVESFKMMHISKQVLYKFIEQKSFLKKLKSLGISESEIIKEQQFTQIIENVLQLEQLTIFLKMKRIANCFSQVLKLQHLKMLEFNYSKQIPTDVIDIILDKMIYLSTLRFIECTFCGFIDLSKIQNFVNLKHLSLLDSKLFRGKNQKFMLKPMLSLQSIQENGEYFKFQFLKSLFSTSPLLTSIHLQNTSLVKVTYPIISTNLTKLQSFSYKEKYCYDDQLLQLQVIFQECTSLKKLDLQGIKKLTNSHIKTLSKLKYLQSLNIMENPQINSQGLIYLKSLIHLKQLRVNNNTKIFDLVIQVLCKMKTLKKVYFNQNDYFGFTRESVIPWKMPKFKEQKVQVSKSWMKIVSLNTFMSLYNQWDEQY